jgi:glutaminyl-peptide cyclotransferase
VIRAPHWLIVCVATVVTAGAGCGNAAVSDEDEGTNPPSEPGTTAVASLVPAIIAETPHDATAFTEGLVFDGPRLYESTGNFGTSQLREIDPTTGATLRSADLPPDFYGEGIAVVDDRIWQLTWKNGVAIEWDKATFAPLRQVPVQGQGWGFVLRRKAADPQRRKRPAALP